MRTHGKQKSNESGVAAAFRWGAAHALDLGGTLVDENDWRGFSADAEAIHGYWEVAITAGSEHVAEAREKE